MTEAVMIQLILSAAGIVAGILAAVKYASQQNKKREEALLKYIADMQKEQIDYYEKKNGHMERMALGFTKALDKNTKVVNKLAVNLEKQK